ncbi:MAG: monovalent cation/H+ antiporter subunit A [Campylobacterales bacterium]
MFLETFGLPLIALLPFLGAAIAPYVALSRSRVAAAWTSGIITILTIVFLSLLAYIPFEGRTLVQSWGWVESIGLEFAFRLDGYSMLFAYIILCIGLLIIIYARYYLSSKDCMGRFYSYLMLFMGSMVGVVLSENVIQLVVFWELTSLSSFLLISYWQDKKEGRNGAMMALAVTGAGGLAMLAGMLLLGEVVGSYMLSDILASGELIKSSPLYTIILILILLGAFTKSAQFPFHFWLPRAMAAPTPVSAYLHSATMVKAGIFLLGRLYPALSGTTEWIVIVSSAGLITLLLGAFVALFKNDLKGLLAYSTVSHLGLITLLFGLSTPLSAVAAIFHTINHATFKASLFMVAGIIDHETGTRDMRKLGGLLKYMPHTATLAMIAAAAMAGVPLLNGFLSKEMFFERALSDGTLLGLTVPFLAVIAGIFSVAYSIRFIHDVFFGKLPPDIPKTPHEPPRFMKIPVDLLVVVCLSVGIVPALTVAPILAVAVQGALQGTPPEYSLAIWHGFNTPLLMSIVAFVGGIVVYINREYLFKWYDKNKIENIDAEKYFDSIISRIFGLATKITDMFDKTSLQNSATWLLATVVFASLIGFSLYSSPFFGSREYMPVDWVSLIIGGMLIIASIATVILHRRRLVALITMGAIGLIISLIFIKFSAPDLALTQISVEVVTVILILLALYYLPQRSVIKESKPKLYMDLSIAGLLGIITFALTLGILSRDYTTIGDYFLANSVPGGGGTNVVNVILVDFRGFDTLGEITVLAIAALGIFAMLQGLSLKAPNRDLNNLPWNSDKHPLMMQTLTRLIFPLMLMVSVYIFFRGHNLPGGGFIAGLIAAVAIIVQYLANGIEWTKQRLTYDKHIIIAVGLLFAFGTGVVPMILSYPYLTSAFTYLNWPIVGKFEVASALSFDLGVFLVVIGSVVMILVSLGKLSLLSHRENDEPNEHNTQKGDS